MAATVGYRINDHFYSAVIHSQDSAELVKSSVKITSINNVAHVSGCNSIESEQTLAMSQFNISELAISALIVFTLSLSFITYFTLLDKEICQLYQSFTSAAFFVMIKEPMKIKVSSTTLKFDGIHEPLIVINLFKMFLLGLKLYLEYLKFVILFL